MADGGEYLIAERDAFFLCAYMRCARRGRMPSMAAFKRRGLVAYGRNWDEPFNQANFDREMSLYTVRRKFIGLFGFALLAHDQVEVLRGLQPLVEIGAGLGFWTLALRNAGLDVIATDLCAEEYKSRGFGNRFFVDVEPIAGADAVLKYADRNVLCVWPTLGDDWPADAIANMTTGRKLALVHEGECGCIGNDKLFETLEAAFTEEIEHPLACWPGIHDRLGIFTKKIADVECGPSTAHEE